MPIEPTNKQLLDKARSSRKEGKYEEALQLTKKAQQSCGEKDYDALGRIFHIYRQLETDQGNFSEALDLFTESLLELEWNERWFEDERQVVLQEIEKVGERPWHRIWNAWDALTFSKHPYGRAVIGDATTIH